MKNKEKPDTLTFEEAFKKIATTPKAKVERAIEREKEKKTHKPK